LSILARIRALLKAFEVSDLADWSNERAGDEEYLLNVTMNAVVLADTFLQVVGDEAPFYAGSRASQTSAEGEA
jgi:hypothetical protein